MTVGSVVPTVDEPVVVLVLVAVLDDVGIGVVGVTGSELSSGNRADFEVDAVMIVEDLDPPIPSLVLLVDVEAGGKV